MACESASVPFSTALFPFDTISRKGLRTRLWMSSAMLIDVPGWLCEEDDWVYNEDMRNQVRVMLVGNKYKKL